MLLSNLHSFCCILCVPIIATILSAWFEHWATQKYMPSSAAGVYTPLIVLTQLLGHCFGITL